MKISRRFATSSEPTPCLASSAEVASPAAPAPTIRTGTRTTLIPFPFQTELVSSVYGQSVTFGRNAQLLRRRRAGKWQDHVFKHPSDVDPVNRPPGHHPQHVETQGDVGDKTQIPAGRYLSAIHRMVQYRPDHLPRSRQHKVIQGSRQHGI